MINYNNPSNSIDYKKWISSDNDPRGAIIGNILNSSNIKEAYESFPGYKDSSNNVCIVGVSFNNSNNTLNFKFSDGSTVSIVLNESSADLSEYITKDDLNNKISELQSGNQWKASVPTFKDISKNYPNPKDGWTVNVDDTDITYRYTGTEWIAISSNSIPLATDELDGKMSSSDKSKLNSINNVKNLVEYSEFDEGRKTIQLRNYDSISGISTTGSGINLAMVSKWDIADYGSTQIPINLNGSKDRPTYNDNKNIALLEDVNSIGVYSLGNVGSFNDIPSKLSDIDVCTKANNCIITFVVSNSTYGDEGGLCRNIYTQGKAYQTLYWKNTIQERVLTIADGIVQSSNFKPIDKVFLRNKSIVGPKLFSLTTDSTEDEIKSALTDTISKELITSSDLDKCYSDGLMIREEVMNGSVMIGWNGSAYTFTQVGLTSPKSDPSLKSIIINVTPEGKYSVIKNGQSSNIVTKSNIGSLLSSYATKEEVLSTYQVKDDLATASKNGVMSKEDKSKLDGLTKITKVSQLQNDSNYLTEHQDLSNLATKEEVSNTYQVKGDYATKSEIPDISDLVTKSEVSDMLTKTEAKSTYVSISDLERLVNEIIEKGKQ